METTHSTAELLRNSKAEILKVWEVRVRETLSAARLEIKSVLRDSIPDFLDEISMALETNLNEVKPQIIKFAHKHGSERANATEYSIEDALTEYNLLRRAIFSVLERTGPLPIFDRDIILEAINFGLAKAAAEYAKLQVKQLEESNALLESSEESSKKSAKDLKQIIDIQPTLISYLDTNYTYKYANKNYLTWFGYDFDKFIGMTVREVVGETVFNSIKAELERAFGGEKVNFERLIQHENEPRFVKATYLPDFDEEKNVIGVFVTAEDISQDKAILDALKSSEEQFIALANSIPQLAWMADASGSVFWYNQRWYEYTGTSLDQMRDWGWKNITHQDYLSKIDEQWCYSLQNGSLFEMTFPLKNTENEFRWFLSRAVPIKNNNGEVMRWLGTYTDVTTQKNLTDSLQEEMILRDKFVSTLSHDLKTPLTAAKMSAQLIQRKSSDDSIAKLSYKIVENINRADIMIDDLLDASKIRAGRGSVPQIQKIDLVELTKKTIEDLSITHGDRFKLHAPTNLTTHMCPNGIRRVLENLCNNAIKYGSPKHPVNITIVYGEHNVSLCVQNVGNPLMVTDREKIFEPFQRGTAAAIEGKKGWGIGLTIVKGVADAHGGEVLVNSSEEGTTFELKLPLDARGVIEDPDKNQQH